MKNHLFFHIPFSESPDDRKNPRPLSPPRGFLTFSLLFLGFVSLFSHFPCAFAGDPNPSCPNVNPRDDLAIGSPYKKIGNLNEAGGVNVLYGAKTGLAASGQFDDQFWIKGDLGLPGATAPGDWFGRTMAVGDFNGDCFLDLAVGAPGESVDGIFMAGSVYVLSGSLQGLHGGGQRWNQNSPGIIGGSQDHDLLGSALVVGDFDKDGFDDLAVGLPGKKVGGMVEAGAVLVIYGSAAGLTANRNYLWHQDVAGVPGTAEARDHFGSFLAAGDFNGDGFSDLAIGVPAEDFSADGDGAVNILYGSAAGLGIVGAQVWTQANLALAGGDKDWFGSALTAGDFNSDGKMDLAIGAPGKSIGGIAVGAVSVLYGTADGLSAVHRDYWHQGLPGLGNAAEQNLFGAALAAGDFNKDGFTDLAIGAPYDEASGVANSGSVYIILGSAAGLANLRQVWHQNRLDGSTATAGDRFGAALASGNFNGDGYADLAVGVPDEEEGTVAKAGAVHIILGNEAGLVSAGNQYWTPNSPSVQGGTAASGDGFGSFLAAGNFGKPGYLFLPILLKN